MKDFILLFAVSLVIWLVLGVVVIPLGELTEWGKEE